MKRRIDYIILHCTATRYNQPFTLEALHAEHIRRGFHGIGYHYYVRRDGTVHRTRPLEQAGAHCLGHNRYSIGIAYEGGLDETGQPADTRTSEQRTALRLLVHQLLQRLGHRIRICGHRDLSPDKDGNGIVEPNEWLKQCPCFDVATEL
ncbi:MAG: N-acetylmuramoyl-L-alanine amidase [Bacteroides sp.]